MKKELKKLISMVGKNILFVFTYLKHNLLSAMEYRLTFFSQALFMVLNDIMFVFIWYLFFQRFHDLNGFQFHDMLGIWIFGAIGFGIVNTIFGNANNISTYISNGGLDFYLAFPKNHLLHLLISRMDVSAIGDLIFPVLVLIFFFPLNLYTISWFVVGSILSAIVLLSFYILVGSLSFWLGRSEELNHSLMIGFMHFSTSPYSVFQGFIKFVIFFIIPAGFATFLPAQLLTEWNIGKFISLIIFTIIFFFFSLFVYNKGLKKYNSGNLINIKV